MLIFYLLEHSGVSHPFLWKHILKFDENNSLSLWEPQMYCTNLHCRVSIVGQHWFIQLCELISCCNWSLCANCNRGTRKHVLLLSRSSGMLTKRVELDKIGAKGKSHILLIDWVMG